MIDLTSTRQVMKEVSSLVDALDGKDLDDEDHISSTGKGRLRQERARLSTDLQLLASRLELAAALVRNEYWFAKGEDDPLSDR